jgi:hypothetical protein
MKCCCHEEEPLDLDDVAAVAGDILALFVDQRGRPARELSITRGPQTTRVCVQWDNGAGAQLTLPNR